VVRCSWLEVDVRARTTDYGPRTTDYGLRTTDHALIKHAGRRDLFPQTSTRYTSGVWFAAQQLKPLQTRGGVWLLPARRPIVQTMVLAAHARIEGTYP